MNEEKWRLVDDNVVISLIYDFKMRVWLDGVMEEEICAISKAIDRFVSNGCLIPVLDLTNKTALPKTPQP
jgi:hypothetical protein